MEVVIYEHKKLNLSITIAWYSIPLYVYLFNLTKMKWKKRNEFWFVTGPTCRKEQTREYYSENGCRSRKPVKMAKCEGSCGSSCCRARKTKRRKVRLICNDGTRYTKDVDIVRKCACTKKCYWLSGPSHSTSVALPHVQLQPTHPQHQYHWTAANRFFFYFVYISVVSSLFIIVMWSLCVCLFLLLP